MARIEKPAPTRHGQKAGQYKRNTGNSCKKFNTSPIEINQVLPCDVEAENDLLAHCLSNPEAVDTAMQIVRQDDFSRAGAGEVFQRMVDFRKSGRSFNPSVILKSFDDHKYFLRFEQFILNLGPFWIMRDMGPVRHYGNIIRETAVKRNLILGCTRIAIAGFSFNPDIADLLNDLKKTIAVSQARLQGKAQVARV